MIDCRTRNSSLPGLSGKPDDLLDAAEYLKAAPLPPRII